MEALRIYSLLMQGKSEELAITARIISAFLVDTDSQGINIREMKNKSECSL